MPIKGKTIAHIVVVIFVVAVLSFLFQSKDMPIEKSEKRSKKFEVHDSYVCGYKDGEICWKIKADYIWSGRSNFLFRAERITTGKLYGSKGRLILDNLKASSIKANSRSKTLSAYGNISGYFVQTKNGKDINEKTTKKYSHVSAAELKYYRFSNKMYLKKGVVLKRKDSIIKPKHDLEIDCELNHAYIRDGFRLDSEEIEASANYMTIYIDDDYAEVSGNIKIKRKVEPCKGVAGYDARELSLRSEPTYLSCNIIKHNKKDTNDIVEAFGNIEVIQGTKKIKAQMGYYNKKDKFFKLWDGVEFWTESLGWIVDKTKKEGFNNQRITDAIDRPAKITCETIKFDAKEKKLILTGDVFFKQDDYSIKCRRVEFNDKESTIRLIGKVRIINIKEGQTLKCDLLDINIENESFEADKGTEVFFEIEKTPK